ncbi:MAG TPA: hypothetical protein ENI99_14015 [Sedimenticola sp.]|nr:hypothetical protein [Sedimenticola sp.]
MPARPRHDPPSTEKQAPSLKSPRDRLLFFFIYRLILSGLLGILFFKGLPPALLGSHNPELFSFVVAAYFGLVLASGLLLALRQLSDDHQTDIAVFVDIAAITLLMHASGGVRTGLGMLLAVSIAAGSLTIRRHTALLFAAIAALAILGEQVYAHLHHDFSTTAYTQAGLLGASFFAMALLADVLSKRLQESEQLASQRELDLANLAQLNEYIIQRMQTGVIIVDDQERPRLRNEAAWNLLGISDATGDRPLEKTCPALFRQLKQWKQNPSHERLTFRSATGGRDLSANFIRLGGKELIGTLIFLEDSALVTEQLQQMKLASLGRLTASIAHEIRNPLGAISHAGQLLEESPHLDEGDKRLTEIIRDNSRRVNEIIENILQLSRRSRTQPEEIELKPWLERIAGEIRRDKGLAPEMLKVRIDPADTRIRTDPSQLRQVLVSLIDNAMRHFHKDPGELRLRIEGGMTADSGGPFVDIIDNGPGIEPETAKQIFEPFFTTSNTGTGLGLYIARELAESNRARLEYTPGPDGGSCFHISFPGLRKKVFNA